METNKQESLERRQFMQLLKNKEAQVQIQRKQYIETIDLESHKPINPIVRVDSDFITKVTRGRSVYNKLLKVTK